MNPLQTKYHVYFFSSCLVVRSSYFLSVTEGVYFTNPKNTLYIIILKKENQLIKIKNKTQNI